MWHLTFPIPAQAGLSLTSVCSVPWSRGGHSWTRDVFTVHGHGSSFFFEVRQCFGLGGGRGMRMEGKKCLYCVNWCAGSDMRCGHCRVWILGAPYLRRWNLHLAATAFISLTWPCMEVLLGKVGVMRRNSTFREFYEKNEVWKRLSVCASTPPIL